MILKVGGNKVAGWNGFTLALAYDSVASTFSFNFYYDSENDLHRKIFKPGSYSSCTVEDNDGELLITGTILNVEHKSGPQKELSTIEGYSKTGILEDCQIPPKAYPLQSEGLSLRTIAERLLKIFDLKLIVTNGVKNPAAAPYHKEVTEKAEEDSDTTLAYESQSVKEFLTEIAIQKGIVITHDNKGNLVFTEANTEQAPVAHFDSGDPATSITMSFNGQGMHSEITVQMQAGAEKQEASEHTEQNPLVKIYRPKVITQTSGTEQNTRQAARAAVGSELKTIAITVNLSRWKKEDKIIKPNSVITVTAPEIGFNKPVRLFVHAATYIEDQASNTAVLNCSLPEAYNSSKIKDIFA